MLSNSCYSMSIIFSFKQEKLKRLEMTTEVTTTTTTETTPTRDATSTSTISTTTSTTTELPKAMLLGLVFQRPEEIDRQSSESKLKDLVQAKMIALRARRPLKKQNTIKVTILLRQRIAKSDPNYIPVHCPHGYGYYLIENSECSKYKRCEEWNENYVSLSIEKCSEGVFDFTKRVCVPQSQYACAAETTLVKFVPE